MVPVEVKGSVKGMIKVQSAVAATVSKSVDPDIVQFLKVAAIVLDPYAFKYYLFLILKVMAYVGLVEGGAVNDKKVMNELAPAKVFELLVDWQIERTLLVELQVWFDASKKLLIEVMKVILVPTGNSISKQSDLEMVSVKVKSNLRPPAEFTAMTAEVDDMLTVRG